MRILVTGSGGRVGRATLARLRGPHSLVTLDRDPAAAPDHVGDAADAALLARALDGCDAVVHVAALHAPHVGRIDDAEFERVNVAGARTLVACARAARVQRIVYTSTTALYGASGDRDAAAWLDERSMPRPRTVYHRTKLAAETLLREAARTGGPSLRILRMSRCFPEAAPLMAAYRLHRGVDARDVADAHALALAHEGADDETWIVSAPTPFRREDVRALARDAPAVIEARAPGLARAFAARGWPLPQSIDRVYDAGAAQRVLGWRARHGFESVLAQLDEGSAEVLRA